MGQGGYFFVLYFNDVIRLQYPVKRCAITLSKRFNTGIVFWDSPGMKTPENSEHIGTVDLIRWIRKHLRGRHRSVSWAAIGPQPRPRIRTVRPDGTRVWPAASWPTTSRPVAATAVGRIDTRTACAAAACLSRLQTAVRNRTAWCPRLLSQRSPGTRNTGRTRRGQIGAGGRYPRPAATRTDASRSSL